MRVEKDVRKVFKIGDSLAITLPPEFIKEHGIKVGDKLEVIFNSFLTAKPMKKEELEKEMKEVHLILRDKK
jgi:antitoxin component of MazEF toxin-antitoxin module